MLTKQLISIKIESFLNARFYWNNKYRKFNFKSFFFLFFGNSDK